MALSHCPNCDYDPSSGRIVRLCPEGRRLRDTALTDQPGTPPRDPNQMRQFYLHAYGTEHPPLELV